MSADVVDKRSSSGKLGKSKSKHLDGRRLEPLVPIIRNLAAHIQTHGAQSEGILRANGKLEDILILKKKLLKGGSVSLGQYDIHVVSGVLKSLLRDLPEPVIPFDLYETMLEAGAASSEKMRLEGFKCVWSQLPCHSSFVIDLLSRMCTAISSYSLKNKMSTQSLAVVLGPSLLRPRFETMQLLLQNSTKVVRATAGFLELHTEILGGTAVVTPKSDTESDSVIQSPAPAPRKAKKRNTSLQRQESIDDMALLRKKVADTSFIVKYEEFSKGGILKQRSDEKTGNSSANGRNVKKSGSNANGLSTSSPNAKRTSIKRPQTERPSSTDPVGEEHPGNQAGLSATMPNLNTPLPLSRREQELANQLKMLEVKTTMQIESQKAQMKTVEADMARKIEVAWTSKVSTVEAEWRKKYEIMDSTWSTKVKFSETECAKKIEAVEAECAKKLKALEAHHHTEMNELEELFSKNVESEDIIKFKARHEEALALERRETEKLRTQAMHDMVTRSQLERQLSAMEHDLKRARLENGVSLTPPSESLVQMQQELSESRKSMQSVLNNIRDKDAAYTALQTTYQQEQKMKSLLEVELKEAERREKYLTAELHRLRERANGTSSPIPNGGPLSTDPSLQRSEITILSLSDELNKSKEAFEQKSKQQLDEVARRVLAEKEARLVKKELKLVKQQIEIVGLALPIRPISRASSSSDKLGSSPGASLSQRRSFKLDIKSSKQQSDSPKSGRSPRDDGSSGPLKRAKESKPDLKDVRRDSKAEVKGEKESRLEKEGRRDSKMDVKETRPKEKESKLEKEGRRDSKMDVKETLRDELKESRRDSKAEVKDGIKVTAKVDLSSPHHGRSHSKAESSNSRCQFQR